MLGGLPPEHFFEQMRRMKGKKFNEKGRDIFSREEGSLMKNKYKFGMDHEFEGVDMSFTA